MDAEVPTIAAVKGPVRAGGIGLMASCDLVVVQRDVGFALTEVRVGVAAAMIAVPILRRASGSRLTAAFLTGEPFDADEARAVGLITHVTDDVDATVATLCDGIRLGAPAAVAATKRILREVPGPGSRRGVRADAAAVGRALRWLRGHGRDGCVSREAAAPIGPNVASERTASSMSSSLTSTSRAASPSGMNESQAAIRFRSPR